MRLPPRWLRRLLVTPILPIVLVLLLVGAPLAVPIGAFVTGYLPGRLRALALFWLGFVFLVRETVAVLLLFGLWVLRLFGADFDGAWQRRQHVRLMGWHLRGLVLAMQSNLGLRVVTEQAPGQLVVEPHVRSHPMVVLSRHAGAGDSFLLLHLLVNVFGRVPSIVLKDRLQWLPSLDMLLNRLGAAFVSPGSRTAVLAAIARLGRDLHDDGALVIFPEGGNFTAARRQRALERLRDADSLRHLHARAAELATVLPPRTAGVQAALAANPDADVVMVAHTGLEGYTNAQDVLAKLPMQHSVRLGMWHLDRAEVPPPDGGPALEDWLYDWWERIDTWIQGHDEPGLPDPQTQRQS